MAGYRRAKTMVTSVSGEESVIICQEGTKVPSGDVRLTVGEVEKLTGVNRETLRFYDSKGLLCPARTGKGVSNNRKLYSVGDLERLQVIQTLRVYDFGLDEIRRILEGGSLDAHDAIAKKLDELGRRAARLRALSLFARYVSLSGGDLIEGLANGPADIDALADLARRRALHDETLCELDEMSEGSAEKILECLRPIVGTLVLLGEAEGFEGIRAAMGEFFDWWNEFVIPCERVGFLGFWAIFEDHDLIPGYIESAFRQGDAGIVQMCAFFVLVNRLARTNGSLIAESAELADNDMIAAMEKAFEFVDTVAFAMLGSENVPAMENSERIGLARYVLEWLVAVLQDRELRRYDR